LKWFLVVAPNHTFTFIHCYVSNNVLKHDNLMNALAFSFNGGKECHDLYFRITTYNWIQHYSTHKSYKVTCLIHYLILMGTIWPFILIHDITSKLSPWVTTWKSKKQKVRMKVKLKAWSQFIMHTTWNFQTKAFKC
jgi:hypothetical protein